MKLTSKQKLAAGAVGGVALLALLIGERRQRLRAHPRESASRLITNVSLGVSSSLTASLLGKALVTRVMMRSDQRGTGLVRRLPAPTWAQEAVAFLLLDYTIYLWHVATHKIPAFWRFHVVHHADLALDTSTALRFHAIDMVVSAPFGAAQAWLIGPSPTTLAIWRAFFFSSVLFHHSNLRLPLGFERRLACVLTTPRMHGVHHTAIRSRTDSNWSSGLSIWDHLHGTFRMDVAPDAELIGVPAYREPDAVRLVPSLKLPFLTQPDAWRGSTTS